MSGHNAILTVTTPTLLVLSLRHHYSQTMSQTTSNQKEKELTNASTGVVGKRKRGNQGDFKGERLQYLNDMLPQYREASSSGTVSTWFTNTFFPNYFRKFPWFIPAEDDIPEAFNVALEESKLTPEVAKTKSDSVNKLVKARCLHLDSTGHTLI